MDNGKLVLTRRLGESIVIGDDVKLTIEKISCNQIRLSFDAPKNVRIDREEVRNKPDYKVL